MDKSKVATNEIIIVCQKKLGEDNDGSRAVDNSFRYEAPVHCELCIFIVLIHIPHEMLRLCQMVDNCKERRESHLDSQCDVTKARPALVIVGRAEYHQITIHRSTPLQWQPVIGWFQMKLEVGHLCDSFLCPTQRITLQFC